MAAPRLEASKDCYMKKKLLLLLFSLASLALVSCGGGNDGASTGTPVVAQATLWSPTDNGGCGNSSSYKGSGPALTVAQQAACNYAIYGPAPGEGVYQGANLLQCNSLGAVMNYNQNVCNSSGRIPACYIPYQVNSYIINAC